MSRLLGDIDPIVMERILETGATADEIGEALRAVEQDRIGEGPLPPPSSSRVAEVQAVLNDLSVLEGDVLEDEEEAYQM